MNFLNTPQLHVQCFSKSSSFSSFPLCDFLTVPNQNNKTAASVFSNEICRFLHWVSQPLFYELTVADSPDFSSCLWFLVAAFFGSLFGSQVLKHRWLWAKVLIWSFFQLYLHITHTPCLPVWLILMCIYSTGDQFFHSERLWVSEKLLLLLLFAVEFFIMSVYIVTYTQVKLVLFSCNTLLNIIIMQQKHRPAVQEELQ